MSETKPVGGDGSHGFVVQNDAGSNDEHVESKAEETILGGQLDPVYEKKAKMLNRAV